MSQNSLFNLKEDENKNKELKIHCIVAKGDLCVLEDVYIGIRAGTHFIFLSLSDHANVELHAQSVGDCLKWPVVDSHIHL